MQATVDGVRWRLRFRHDDLGKVPKFKNEGEYEEWLRRTTAGLKRRKGHTLCFVEVYEVYGSEIQGWIPESVGATKCGRSESRFDKEQGRQFSMIRALRELNEKLPPVGDTGESISAFHRKRRELNNLQRMLVSAYIRSGNRVMCKDLEAKGFINLYDAVFDPHDIWGFEERFKARQKEAERRDKEEAA